MRTITTTQRQGQRPEGAPSPLPCLSREAWAYAMDEAADRGEWIADTTWERAGLYGHRDAA